MLLDFFEKEWEKIEFELDNGASLGARKLLKYQYGAEFLILKPRSQEAHSELRND